MLHAGRRCTAYVNWIAAGCNDCGLCAYENCKRSTVECCTEPTFIPQRSTRFCHLNRKKFEWRRQQKYKSPYWMRRLAVPTTHFGWNDLRTRYVYQFSKCGHQNISPTLSSLLFSFYLIYVLCLFVFFVSFPFLLMRLICRNDRGLSCSTQYPPLNGVNLLPIADTATNSVCVCVRMESTLEL